MDQVYDALRAANVALLTLAVTSLVVWLTDTWEALSLGRRISMVSVRLLLIGGIVGSAIKYATHAPTDVSVLIVAIGSLGVIVGQWMARHDRPHLVSAIAVLAIIERADEGGPAPCTHPGCIAAREQLRRLAAADR